MLNNSNRSDIDLPSLIVGIFVIVTAAWLVFNPEDGTARRENPHIMPVE